MKRFLTIGVIFVCLIMLAGCIAGPNPDVRTPAENGKTAGFWAGLWHGLFVPITFFVSLFADDVTIYEVHNNGGWYDFGFLLGAGALLGGGRFLINGGSS